MLSSVDKPIRSVDHMLQLFEVFRTYAKEEYGVTELSNAVGLHKNNVFRLLATLCSRGFIEQNTVSENYRLGLGIFNLGEKFIHRFGMLSLAKPFMKKLTQGFGESSYIGILHAESVVYLGISEALAPVRVASRVGKSLPAHATDVGKVLLSELNGNALTTLYHHKRLTRCTPNTITSFTELKSALREAAQNGYAIDDEELEEGVRSVAVIIRGYQSQPVAALSVSAPADRLCVDRIKNEIVPVLSQYSLEISKRSGYDEP
jgi:DNA-binding IclR family transcriptional regulator